MKLYPYQQAAVDWMKERIALDRHIAAAEADAAAWAQSNPGLAVLRARDAKSLRARRRETGYPFQGATT